MLAWVLNRPLLLLENFSKPFITLTLICVGFLGVRIEVGVRGGWGRGGGGGGVGVNYTSRNSKKLEKYTKLET